MPRLKANPIPVTPELLAFFNANISTVPVTGCWLWMSYLHAGYGRMRKITDGVKRVYPAHRFAYEAFKGRLDPDLTIDHLCRHTWCVNPDHLEQVTAAENTIRGDSLSGQRSRLAACKRGHPFDARRKDGSRDCTVCTRMRNLRWREAHPGWRKANDAKKRARAAALLGPAQPQIVPHSGSQEPTAGKEHP